MRRRQAAPPVFWGEVRGVGGLKFSSAGESHGPAQVCILQGVPAGLSLDVDVISADLQRRRRGYGRGARMAIEDDAVRILSGVRHGTTLGTPVALLVENRDHQAWRPTMQVEAPPDGADVAERVSIPRPGHADAAGLAKYGHEDVRNVLERASARETVMRVAAGAVARRLLCTLGVVVAGRVTRIGSVEDRTPVDWNRPDSVDWEEVERSPVGCLDSRAAAQMMEEVDRARESGESLGGVFEVWAWGLVPGVGGYGHPSERLDGRLMGAVGSIPAVKGVEIGLGFRAAALPGSQVHDTFVRLEDGMGAYVARPTNRAGGVEGGMTNGCPVIVHAAMKPIPTLTRPLPSVDLSTMEAVAAHKERSDIMAVPAARVVGEAMVALVLASAYLEKFGGDSVTELHRAVSAYKAGLEERGLWRASSH